MDASYLNYWGKAGANGELHRLAYHALDVAACGSVLIARHHGLHDVLSARLGIREQTLSAWLTFMLALHDAGKFSYRFQYLRTDLALLGPDIPRSNRYSIRHDTLGWLIWRERLQTVVLENHVAELNQNRQMKAALNAWFATATGHHGQPPGNPRQQLDDQFTPHDQRAAIDLCSAVGDLLLPGERLGVSDAKMFANAVKRSSWWLAGIAVLCDWLGSNRDLFAYRKDPLPLAIYWNEVALPRAAQAIEHSGVLPLRSAGRTQRELFDYLNPPTPLQCLARELALSASPQLLILEDVTGAGKTEAALTAAHRIQSIGAADGIYLGLPTMATSNAMYRRIDEQALPQKLFIERPAVMLTHGAARMMSESTPRESLLPEAPAEGDYQADETSAANLRAAWLSDHRKKALLADLGVGTIDQALLAVLPSRHQSLRLLGLARKVLIVDEVHAHDPYMQKLLEGLLRFHAFIGGHAILLSATLPRATRQSLLDAFRDGLSQPPAPATRDDYPLLTRVDSEGIEEIPIETRPEVARDVQVTCIDETATAVQVLLEARQQGQCACWVRNSVDDAIDAWEELQAADVPADRLILFHARFALGDRLAIEKRVLECFGPASGPGERRGMLLIATQVVEQSLDLDFDVMVTDLAPIDLIIQRAGRLRRHSRRRDGSSAEQDERGAPCLYLLTPVASDDAGADWLAALLPKTARVYEDIACLWRTARLLQSHRAIRMPGAARTLIEGVYAEDDNAIPAPVAVEDASINAEAARMEHISMANFNTLKLSQGYATNGPDYWDDIVAPTRLAEPTVRVRLARWDHGKLTPWYSDGVALDWNRSELGLYQHWLSAEAEPRDEALAREIVRYRQQVPDQGRWSLLLPLVPNDGDGWQGEGIDGRGDPVRFDYDATTGLRRAAANQ